MHLYFLWFNNFLSLNSKLKCHCLFALAPHHVGFLIRSWRNHVCDSCTIHSNCFKFFDFQLYFLKVNCVFFFFLFIVSSKNKRCLSKWLCCFGATQKYKLNYACFSPLETKDRNDNAASDVGTDLMGSKSTNYGHYVLDKIELL